MVYLVKDHANQHTEPKTVHSLKTVTLRYIVILEALGMDAVNLAEAAVDTGAAVS